jgi:hypothetical protein
MRQVVLRRKNEPPDTWAAFLLRRVEVIASELLLSGVYSQKPVIYRPIIPAAQASTAIPSTMRYTANGAKPRLRT